MLTIRTRLHPGSEKDRSPSVRTLNATRRFMHGIGVAGARKGNGGAGKHMLEFPSRGASRNSSMVDSCAEVVYCLVMKEKAN